MYPDVYSKLPYWKKVHRHLRPEMVSGILMTAYCCSCWSRWVCRHLFPLCIGTQNNSILHLMVEKEGLSLGYWLACLITLFIYIYLWKCVGGKVIFYFFGVKYQVNYLIRYWTWVLHYLVKPWAIFINKNNFSSLTGSNWLVCTVCYSFGPGLCCYFAQQ